MSINRLFNKKSIFIAVLVLMIGQCSFFPIQWIFAIGFETDALKQELAEIEKEITEYEQKISATKDEERTLANTIRRLQNERAKIKLEIQKSTIHINDLSSMLTETKKSIQEARVEEDAVEEQIGAILRALNRHDQKSLITFFILEGDFVGFFDELKDLERLSGSLTQELDELKITKKALEELITLLEEQRTDTGIFLAMQALQKETVVVKESEQRVLLEETRGREEAFQEILSERQKRAAAIRSQIYELLGVSQQITFGEAVEIANWASGQTGVRVPFLLAVLTQESNLGKNVGTCNRLGDPPEKSWRKIMKPERDQEPFLAITKELGLDPDITPVSCPMRDKNGSQIGWGGAMGPAQFIPSTWLGYKDRLAAIIRKTPNPWDIRDAFLAAAVLLRDNGATSGGEDGEWKAAMRYFSGSTNPRFRFYGDRVMELTRQYEEDIELINS